MARRAAPADAPAGGGRGVIAGDAPWDGGAVRTWLESRIAASKLDQAAADRQGYEARDDYDKAAAEEWACRALLADDSADDSAAMAKRIKALLAQEEYRVAGVNDDERFERHVRAALRKVAKMAKANEGWANTRRFQ